MQRTDHRPAPGTLLAWLLVGNVAVIAGACAHGLWEDGNFGAHTDSIYIAAVSAVQMLTTAWLAFRIFEARRQRAGWLESLRKSYLVWALIGAGFVFLPIDETFGLHQRMDGFVHRSLAMKETRLSDSIDDAIIVGYGMIGLGVLFRYRRELGRYDMRRWLVGGFIFVGISVIFDAACNRPDVALWLASGVARLGAIWEAAFRVCEALSQLVAEATFLVAFYSALRMARERIGSAGMSLPAAA